METLVYLNGKIIPEEESKVSIFDIGFLYGATFMEAVRTFKHRYFKLDEHIERLDKSLNYAGLGSLMNDIDIKAILADLLDRYTANLDREDDCWTCINITPGQGFPQPLMEQSTVKHKPTVAVYITPLPYSEYCKYYFEGKHAFIPNIRNIPHQSLDPKCKSRSRLHYFIAKREALIYDPDAFALLLDLQSNITESSGANFFIVAKSKIYTSQGESVLNGISRDMVFELAKELKIEAYEKNINLYDVYNSDEAFFTTTSYCILPVSKVNNVKIGSEIPGQVTKRLLDLWSKQVGVDIVQQAVKFSNYKK